MIFPAYFQHFQKSDSAIFWASTIREIQEILFFQWKSAVPAIFREFRLQKSVLLTIEQCLMVGIVINNVFVWKNNKIKGKSPIKICTNSDFRHISSIFGRKRIFLKNRTRPYASLCKKSDKTNEEISRKCQKTGFFSIFPAFSAGNEFFFENRAPSHFEYCHFASLCQKSEKTNELLSRKAGNRLTFLSKSPTRDFVTTKNLLASS